MLKDIMTVSCFVVVLRLMTDGAFTDMAQMHFWRELEFETSVSESGLAPLGAKFDVRTPLGSAGKPALKLSLAPSFLVLEKSGRKEVKVTCTLTGLTDRDLSWNTTVPAVVGVTKTNSTDTWAIEGLSEGLAELTVVANADRNATASLPVRVLPSG